LGNLVKIIFNLAKVNLGFRKNISRRKNMYCPFHAEPMVSGAPVSDPSGSTIQGLYCPKNCQWEYKSRGDKELTQLTLINPDEIPEDAGE